MCFRLPATSITGIIDLCLVDAADEDGAVPDRAPIPCPVVAVTPFHTDVQDGVIGRRRIAVVHPTRHVPCFGFGIRIPGFVTPDDWPAAPEKISHPFGGNIRIPAVQALCYFVIIRY